MIQLTRLNGQPFVLNSDLVKSIERSPDTVMTLLNGEKIVVRETSEQIVELIVEFRRRILEGLSLGTCGFVPPVNGGNPESPKDSSSKGT